MDIIEYRPELPIRNSRGPLNKLRSLLARKKLSRAGKAHVNDLLERELLDQLESERYVDQVERRVNMADGEIRAEQYLRDENARFQALSDIRRLSYLADTGRRRINVLNDYARQTGELAHRQPHLAREIEEMQRQFLNEVNGSQEIT